MPPSLVQFIKFGMVGTIGFAVDASVLYLLLTELSVGPYVGRLLSFACAATATWLLNRCFTFRDSPRAAAVGQWMCFVSVAGVGGAVNYAVYASLVASDLGILSMPLFGVAAGSLAGLAFNFTLSRRLVFRAPMPGQIGRSPAAGR